MTKVEWNLPIKPREQLLFVGFLLALVFVLFRMGYAPMAESLSKIKTQTQTLLLEKVSLQKMALVPPEKLKPLSRRKDVKIRILTGDILPAYQDVSTLLTRLTEPAFIGGMQIQDLSYAPVVELAGYEFVDFKMKLRGSFIDVLRYIEKMEEFPALFSLENLSVHVIEGQTQEVESEILGRFFKIADPASKAKKDSDKKAKTPDKSDKKDAAGRKP